MKTKRCMDKSMFETNTTELSMDMNTGMPNMMGCNCPNPQNMMGCGCTPQNMMCPPIMECPQVRCCHRVINYEVPHIIPCHTKMINHHVYRHTYQPCFSYSEEDECSEVYDQKCC